LWESPSGFSVSTASPEAYVAGIEDNDSLPMEVAWIPSRMMLFAQLSIPLYRGHGYLWKQEWNSTRMLHSASELDRKVSIHVDTIGCQYKRVHGGFIDLKGPLISCTASDIHGNPPAAGTSVVDSIL
jgi:hypothetical protein